MIRACFVTSGLGAGGAEHALLRLARLLPGAGIEPHVISLRDDGAIGAELRAAGVSVTALGLPAPLALASTVPRLLSIVGRLRPQVLQGWMYHGNLAATVAAMFAPGNVRLFWAVRQTLQGSDLDRTSTRWVNALCARLSARPAGIVYCAQAARDDHERIGYSPARAVVVPNGFDTARWRPDAGARAALRRELDLGDQTPIVGHVARLHPVKDHATLLRAAGEVVRRHRDAVFVLAGEGVAPGQPELERMVDQHGLRANVRLLGYRSDVERLVPAFDVACLTSRAEAFPNVIGEAMSCGVPCVSTAVGDVAMLMGATGTVVPVGDAGALAAALLALLDDHGRRAELGVQARQRIVDHYSLGRAAARYTALYTAPLAQTEARTA